jgi:hypothetical protein
MRTVHTYKADPLTPRGPVVEPTVIWVDLVQPEFASDKALVDARKEWDAEAKRIADALWSALPGGTISALMREMLERHACLYRVTMPIKTEDMTKVAGYE